jgi:hypothetical protein
VDTVARRGQWYFDVYLGYPMERQDSVVYSGQGVNDLDRLIQVLASGTSANGRFLCDVGFNYSVYKPFDIEDVQRIRTRFIAVYGTVNRIDVYAPKPDKEMQLPQTEVAVSP